MESGVKGRGMSQSCSPGAVTWLAGEGVGRYIGECGPVTSVSPLSISGGIAPLSWPPHVSTSLRVMASLTSWVGSERSCICFPPNVSGINSDSAGFLISSQSGGASLKIPAGISFERHLSGSLAKSPLSCWSLLRKRPPLYTMEWKVNPEGSGLHGNGVEPGINQ